MDNIKANFSTELFGYDNDSLPGIIVQNTFSVFQSLIDLPEIDPNVSAEDSSILLKKAGEELKRRINFVNSIVFNIKDTGQVVPTTDSDLFKKEEKEFKVQNVEVVFSDLFSKSDCQTYLNILIDKNNTSKDKYSGSEAIEDRAFVYLSEVDDKILNTILNSLH